MNYIFSTGLPRSGSALLTKSLYASNRISMPVGPNLEIYRFLRDKIISKYGSISLKKKVIIAQEINKRKLIPSKI